MTHYTRNARIRIWLIYIILYTIGSVCYFTNHQSLSAEHHLALGMIQTIAFAALPITLLISANHRILQAGILYALRHICGLLACWIALRGLKYYISVPYTPFSRYLWYGYYLPILLIPVFSVFIALELSQPDHYHLPRLAPVLPAISFLLLLLVFTNDLHQLCFIFPDGAPFSDRNYVYGHGYYLLVVWLLICSLFSYFIMLRKCRRTNRRFLFYLPMLPLACAIIYSIFYVRGDILYFRDMTTTWCSLIVLTYQTAMDVGLIRTNSNYEQIFYESSIQAQITDKAYHIIFAQEDTQVISVKDMQTVLQSGEVQYGTQRYLGRPIQNGYIFWKEDISELLHLQQELESANEYLIGKNSALLEANRSDKKRKRLEEKNRLYNRMQEQTSDKVAYLFQLLDQIDTVHPQDEAMLLCRIGMISTFLKRRNNLLFLSEESLQLPIRELVYCIRESARNLEVFHIPCMWHCAVEETIPFSHMVFLYDRIEAILEETVSEQTSYFVTIEPSDYEIQVCIRVSGITAVSSRIDPSIDIEEDDSDEYRFIIRIHDGDTDHFRKTGEGYA